MKKSLIILALFTILISSCMSYTCPTYAKKPVKLVEQEKQMQKQNI